jgi:hypothetical protein
MMLACVCPSQIIVEILHNLAAAASPAEPALKSEMLALLGDEAETNACWAQLRIAKGENDPPLLPNGLGDIREALDDSQQGDRYRKMYERLKRRADAVRLDEKLGKELTADRLLRILLRVLARKPVRRLFIYELWTRMWCAPSHPPPHTRATHRHISKLGVSPLFSPMAGSNARRTRGRAGRPARRPPKSCWRRTRLAGRSHFG